MRARPELRGGGVRRQLGAARRRARLLAAGAALAAAAMAGCAPIPQPDALAELDRVRTSPGAAQARRDAPSSFDHAERLRELAQAASDAGDYAGAQFLAERAHAAYVHASVLARVARAERVQVAAQAEADQTERALAVQDAEHQRVAADIAALELRLKVLRNAEPIAPSGAAPARRERARQEAVRALQLQARLLCAAAQLLAAEQPGQGAPPTELSDAQRELEALGGRLASGLPAAPIDEAMRVRASCLRALTMVRRAAAGRASAAGSADALLEQLSKAGHGVPTRDDRGVVVTLRHVFAGAGLSAAGKRALSALAQVAQQHADFPLMVVLHQSQPVSPAQQQRWRERGRAVASALGREDVPVEMAGTAQPVVDPRGGHAARNERVELVFVALRQP